jgi:peptidoglycan/xylan/chitin deacetylase (PgdA/CDA1 family)
MKALILFLAALFSTYAIANGRCQGLHPAPDPSCQPPAEPMFVPVLMYHQFIDGAATREIISVDKFREQVEWLRQEGYLTVTVTQLTEFMEGRAQLPNKTVAITIDDGWASALSAADILRANTSAATFYIISGVFDHPEYMNKAQVKALSDNPSFEIGAHSHTHLMEWINDLSKLDTRVAVGEMLMSKRLVEEVIGKPVRSYAWPFGYVRSEMIPFTGTAGFTSTVHVNAMSMNTKGMSASDVRRVNIDGRCTLEQFKSMVTTGRLERCNEEANGLDQKPIW